MINMTLRELYTYYDHYKILKHKFERGDFIKNLAVDLGCHPCTINRAFKDLKKGSLNSNSRKDKGIFRFPGMTQEECIQAAKLTAAMKMEMATKTGKTASTEAAIRALYNAGQIKFLIPDSTMNRWLNQLGFSFKQIRNYSASTDVRLGTDEPNKWWFIDFSVSEIYYLSKHGNIVLNKEGIITDKNHREEILTKKGYRKLIIGCVVDLFSDAYWVNGYVSPGESSYLVLNFLMDAMQVKDNPQNPFRGIPQNIYVDKGSALHSQQMRDLLEPLGIQIWSHTPGNPKAKGRVERRIGTYKNSIERCFAFEKPRTIEEYRAITQKMIIADNIKKGYYQRWMNIYKTDNLREFDEATRQKLGYTMHERIVNVRGCIELNKEEYFVSRRLSGERVAIYTLMDGTMKALDRMGNVYELTGIDHQYREMGKFKADKKTQYDYALDEIKSEGRRLRKIVKPEHFLPDLPENLVMLERQGEKIEVIAPYESVGIASVDDAWYEVYKQTGYSHKQLPKNLADTINELFLSIIAQDKEIARELFTDIIEYIIDEVKEVQVL
ncbi:MAG: transposase family protein [Leptospirales bacterium]|nr:transposase family protein [Leptospirales bacterium]